MKKKTQKTPAKRNCKSETLPTSEGDCDNKTSCLSDAIPSLRPPAPEPTIYDRRKSLLRRIESQIREVEYLQTRLLREQVDLAHSRNAFTNLTRELQAELALTAASA